MRVGFLLTERALGFAVRISMSSAERRVAWALLGAVALANWAYVLLAHR